VRLLALVSFLLLSAQPLVAQQLVGFEPAELRDGLARATDSIVALSAGPEIGTGTYDLQESDFFDEMDSTQFKIRIYAGPWIQLDKAGVTTLEGEAPSEGLTLPPEPIPFAPRTRPFVYLNYGSNLATARASRLPPLRPFRGNALSSKAKIEFESTSLRGGGGIRFDLSSWFSLLPTFTVSYNHVRGRAKGTLFDRAILERDFNRSLVDWRSDSLTFIPELEFRFTLSLKPVELRATLYLSYLETRVFSSTTSFQDNQTNSNLTVLLLEFDWNTGWSGFFGQDFHVVPAFRYSHIHGDAVDGLGTRHLLQAELALQFDTTETVPFSARLGVHARYIFAVDVRAWSVGVSHEF
jgi:hypothetical protein